MKRRSFIGSVLAMISAIFVWPRIPKAAPVEELELFTAPSTIITRNAHGFEIGDMVYWDSDGKCLKACMPGYPPKEYQRVMGIVVDSGSIDNNATITLRGIE